MEEVAAIEHRMGPLQLPVDAAVAALAATQHGVVSRRQLVELGLGRGAIRHRLEAGRLHPLHRGVYAVGHRATTGQALYMSGVLACPPGTVLSHRSAAALWRLRASARRQVEVTTPGTSLRGVAGITVHRARGLHPEDRTVRHQIPVTSVPRTLLDLAQVLSAEDLERALEEAERLRRFDLRAIEALCRRSRHRRGCRLLVTLLAEQRADVPHTRSEFERRFLRVCRELALPVPSVNIVIAGHEVDMVWPDRGLIVELDGHAFHGTRRAFERDRVRDAALQIAGYRVIRVTYRRLAREPDAVMRDLASLLDLD